MSPHDEQRRWNVDPLHRIANLLERLVDQELRDINRKLDKIMKLEVKQMAFQQDALDAVAANTTLIGSVRVLVEQILAGLGDQVTPEAKAAILAALSGNRTELAAVEAALLAHVPPPPPTP